MSGNPKLLHEQKCEHGVVRLWDWDGCDTTEEPGDDGALKEGETRRYQVEIDDGMERRYWHARIFSALMDFATLFSQFDEES